MRVNATRYVILGLLADGPMSGYDVKRLVDRRLRFFWSESYGQIYPQLKRLAADGWAEQLPADAEGGRPKRTYRITPAGREAFAAWMARPPEGDWQRNEFLLKVMWAPWGAPERIRGYVEEFRARHRRDREDLERMEAEMENILDRHENHPWVLRTIRLGLAVNAASLSWASEVLSETEENDGE
jgi:PadR family transcriptional regulator AphA